MARADDPDAQPRIIALLRIAAEQGHELLYRRLAEAGHRELRPAHFRLLRFPGPDGVRPSALALRQGTTKQAINPLINDLERWGYLARVADPLDRRARLLRLTPRGHELLAEIRRLHAQIEEEWAAELGERRFRTLKAALRELAATDRLGPAAR